MKPKTQIRVGLLTSFVLLLIDLENMMVTVQIIFRKEMSDSFQSVAMPIVLYIGLCILLYLGIFFTIYFRMLKTNFFLLIIYTIGEVRTLFFMSDSADIWNYVFKVLFMFLLWQCLIGMKREKIILSDEVKKPHKNNN